MKKLGRKFFIRDAIKAAKGLLGKYIVRKIGARKIIGRIVETEAYIGPYDRASHAYLGKRTKRNTAEYMVGGHIYIYLVYGMYWQFNISTGKKDVPECVLLRALEPVVKDESRVKNEELKNLANGPGKLCRYLKIDKSFYAVDLCKNKKIWVSRKAGAKPIEIAAASRVGIDYAGPFWSRRKWRFYIKGNPFVSKITR